MIIVIVFSGKNPPKEKTISPQPAAGVVDPNAQRIQEYEKGIEEETRKIRLEQAQVARTQGALGLGLPPATSGILPPVDPRYASPREPGFAASYPAADDTFASDLHKREYQSRFASNVALSYRRAPGVPEPASSSSASSPGSADQFSVVASAKPATQPGFPQTTGAAPPPHTVLFAPGQNQVPGTPTPGPESDQGRIKQYRIFEGTVLETVLTNRLDGSFSGPVNCMVTTNVYSHNGLHLLIPQGSRVLGEVRRVDNAGQQRLAVVFHRLIMPDGYSISLDKYQGLNQIGETGLQDQVNHHYMQIFGVSLAIGAIAGISQANTNYGSTTSATDAYRQGVASSLSQSSLHILDRYLNVLPTFTIREGQRVKVYLSGDLLVPANDQHDLPDDL
jgi:type IV secretion system protein VirB10